MKKLYNQQELRVLGCLIEKEKTTPDQYPLSLNAVVTACNQKSSREPVMELSEQEVQAMLDSLKKKHAVADQSGFGSRVVKYRHRFCNTEFNELKLSEQELGLLCVLMLRGAQTPGELRTRTNRLCEFDDVAQVERILQQLSEHKLGPLVVQLPRLPGNREHRYQHTLAEAADSTPVEIETRSEPAAVDRVTQLEQQVLQLSREVEALQKRLDEAGI